MKKFLVVLAVTFFLVSGFSYAQEQTGDLAGTITDEEKAPLPGVTVVARSPALIRAVSSMTNEFGRYRLLRLPPGIYDITFTLAGFQTLTRSEIIVRLGSKHTLNVTMGIAAIEEEVTVVGESPIVDIRKTGTTIEIPKEMFSVLPRGRDFTSIITITPGVNQESELGDNISFDGATHGENMFFVDGVDTTDVQVGISAQTVMFDFVEELQVKSSGYEPQYGGSMGGVINVLTQSGGNEFHGQAIIYHESSSLIGTPRPSLQMDPYDSTKVKYVSYAKDPWSSFELGFSLGGYLIKDRLWFFASYLPRFQTITRDAKFLSDPTKDARFATESQWHNLSFKLTAQPLSRLRLNASFINDYYQYRGTLPSQAGTGNPDQDYARQGQNYPGWTATLRSDYTVSDNLFITASAGMWKTNQENIVGPPGPWYAFNFSNAAMPGVPADMIRAQGWTNYSGFLQLVRDLRTRSHASVDGTYYFDLSGEHVVKAGFRFNRIGMDIFNAAPYGLYRFYWGQDYTSPTGAGVTPTQYGYLMSFDKYGGIADIKANRYALYLQDSWTIGNKLTLSFGVRAEREIVPSFEDPTSPQAQQNPEILDPVSTFDYGDKLAPRFGFSYDVFGDSSLKVFGSAGVYYDVMKLFQAYIMFGGWKSQVSYYHIDAAMIQDFQVPDDISILGLQLIEFVDWHMPATDYIEPGLKPMAKAEYTLGLQKKLGENLSFTVRFLHSRILWAIEDVGIAVPGEGVMFFNANPGSDFVKQKFQEAVTAGLLPAEAVPPKAKREYYSVDFAFDKRFSNNWLGGLHYTWSRLWGNYSGLRSSDQHGGGGPNAGRYFDDWADAYTQSFGSSEGLLNTDRPHVFKAYGAYSLDFGLTIGMKAYAMVGTPVSTNLKARFINFYPLGRSDQGRTPFLWYGDLYAQYDLKISDKNVLQLSINVENISNNRIAQRLFNDYNQNWVWPTDDEITQGFDFTELVKTANALEDPRYLKEMSFLTPIAVRIGIKFIF